MIKACCSAGVNIGASLSGKELSEVFKTGSSKAFLGAAEVLDAFSAASKFCSIFCSSSKLWMIFFTSVLEISCCCSIPNPVAITVTETSFPSCGSSPTPIIILVWLPASVWIKSLISPISSMVISSEPETISSKTFLQPVILLSLSKGESKALEIASWARLEPDAVPDPIMAVPELVKTVLASFRSMFCV